MVIKAEGEKKGQKKSWLRRGYTAAVGGRSHNLLFVVVLKILGRLVMLKVKNSISVALLWTSVGV